MFVGYGLLGVVVATTLVAGYVRFAPAEPERWHVDPVTVDLAEGNRHVLLRPGDDGANGPVFDLSPEELLRALDTVAMSEPRVTRLAGDPAEGIVTYVARSALWGFPDMISVRALPADDGTRLAVYARQRFGGSDWGVNAARVKRWLNEVEAQNARS